MRSGDIKVGHIYYVDFEPVRKGEFDKYHMALVLKKNANKITFITVPLTSNADGLGVNKMEISISEMLPKNLRDKKSYVVYDQVRTVSASRFHNLMDNGSVCDVAVDKSILLSVLTKIIHNLLYGMDDESVNVVLDACKSVEKNSK